MKNCLTLLLASIASLLFSSPAGAQTITIMPMGDSITLGVDYATHSAGGYRDPLYTKLKAMGITPQFVGASDANPTAALTAAGNQFHNGYGFYRVQNLLDNLDADKTLTINGQPYGDSSRGGYWITGGHGTGREAVQPNLILLDIGANDFLQNDDTPHINLRLYNLITSLHKLSPQSIILVAGASPFNNNVEFNLKIKAYDLFIKNKLATSLSYIRFVDMYSVFLNPNGSTNSAYYGTDNVHPNDAGYPAMATVWAEAIKQSVKKIGHAK